MGPRHCPMDKSALAYFCQQFCCSANVFFIIHGLWKGQQIEFAWVTSGYSFHVQTSAAIASSQVMEINNPQEKIRRQPGWKACSLVWGGESCRVTAGWGTLCFFAGLFPRGTVAKWLRGAIVRIKGPSTACDCSVCQGCSHNHLLSGADLSVTQMWT